MQVLARFNTNHVILPYFGASFSNNTAKRQRLKRCGTICIKFMFGIPHILVVRGAVSHIWSLPKGCMNPGESEMDCAMRETIEETGLVVPLDHTHRRVCINHNVYFVTMITHHEKLRIQDKHEVDKVHWLTLQELRGLPCNKDLRSILEYPRKRFHFHSLLEDVLQLSPNNPIVAIPVIGDDTITDDHMWKALPPGLLD